MKRAQAAMEFLMTYGWAILVVLIAIGALAYFGVLRPEQYLPEKCTISTGSGLFCSEFTTDATDDTVILKIHNILTDEVDITSISTNDPPGCTLTSCTKDPIPPDDTSDCTLDCTTDLKSGETKIKASITIKYKIGTSTLEKGATGMLTTVVP